MPNDNLIATFIKEFIAGCMFLFFCAVVILACVGLS